MLGLILVPAFGTHGAAAAGVATESLLALALFVAFWRLEPGVAPRLGFAWRPLLAAAAGAVPPLVLDLSGWIRRIGAASAYSSPARSVIAGSASTTTSSTSSNEKTSAISVRRPNP